MEEKGGREPSEDTELASARRTGAREARVEALLQRGFFTGGYAVAVACLYMAMMHDRGGLLSSF